MQGKKRKNAAAVALGRRGGLASAKALELDPVRRKKLRQHAAQVRWQRAKAAKRQPQDDEPLNPWDDA